MSKALNQISKLPFTHKIEDARLPSRFHQPTFTIYNGQTDPVEHVSHFNQRMVIHSSKDEALMCKVFPFSLGPVAMRWFDSLKADSISSFRELTQLFGSRFILFPFMTPRLASPNGQTTKWKSTSSASRSTRNSSATSLRDFRTSRKRNASSFIICTRRRLSISARPLPRTARVKGDAVGERRTKRRVAYSQTFASMMQRYQRSKIP